MMNFVAALLVSRDTRDSEARPMDLVGRKDKESGEGRDADIQNSQDDWLTAEFKLKKGGGCLRWGLIDGS